MAPSHLHHSDSLVGKVVDHPAYAISTRNEVGVEDQNELTRRFFESRFQRAGFEAFAIVAMMINNVKALFEVLVYRSRSDLLRVIGRIVQHLNLEQLTRIVQLDHCLDQPLGDIHLIEQRQLHRDARQAACNESGFWLRAMLLIAKEQIDKAVAIHTINGQQPEDTEVNRHEINVQRVIDVQVADVPRGIASTLRRRRSNELVDCDIARLCQRQRQQRHLSSFCGLD